MCDCVKKVIEQFKELFPGAERIDFVNQELFTGKLFSTLEVKMPDKKKAKEVPLLHSYCPICGEKYHV